MRPPNWRITSPIVRGLACPDRFAEVDRHRSRGAQQGARHRVVGDAHADGGGGRDGRGQVRALREDEGQRAGPEAGGEAARPRGDRVRHLVEVGRVRNQNRDGFFERAVFGAVDGLDSRLVKRQRAEAVNRVGGEGDQPARAQDFERAWDGLRIADGDELSVHITDSSIPKGCEDYSLRIA